MIVPRSSTTATWIPSFLPPLSETYLFVVGLGARDFQNTVEFSSPSVCWSYQSTAVTISADTAVFAAFGAPVLIPELLTKNTVVAAIPAPPPSVVVLY